MQCIKSYKEIVYPLYELRGYTKITEREGIVYVATASGDTILDNRNLAGDTLGKRRLRMSAGIKKYYLSKQINNLVTLVKRDGNSMFIDTSGAIFKYKKSTVVKLTYHRIIGVEKIEGKGLLLHIHGVQQTFLTKNTDIAKGWVGLLNITGGYLLYELTAIKVKNTWRMI